MICRTWVLEGASDPGSDIHSFNNCFLGSCHGSDMRDATGRRAPGAKGTDAHGRGPPGCRPLSGGQGPSPGATEVWRPSLWPVRAPNPQSAQAFPYTCPPHADSPLAPGHDETVLQRAETTRLVAAWTWHCQRGPGPLQSGKPWRQVLGSYPQALARRTLLSLNPAHSRCAAGAGTGHRAAAAPGAHSARNIARCCAPRAAGGQVQVPALTLT